MVRTKSRGIARKIAAVLIIAVLVIGSGIYVAWLRETGQPPFCHGYPPGGDCPGNYSYTFQVSFNYTGSWRASYYGFHSVGMPFSPLDWIGNYTGGSFSGNGNSVQPVTLSGPNTNGLTICVQAEKLDSSSSTLTMGIDSRTNSTSLPSGYVSLCSAVVP
jgi:hypothetical protein